MNLIIKTLTKLISLYFIYILVVNVIDLSGLVDDLTFIYNSEMLGTIVKGPIGLYSIIVTFLCLAVIPLEVSDLTKWKYSRIGYFIFNLLVVIGNGYLVALTWIILSNNTLIESSIPLDVMLSKFSGHFLLIGVSLIICSLMWIERNKGNNALKKESDSYSNP